MKKTIAFLTCCLIGLNLNAQSKWYLIGSGTAGITGIKEGTMWPDRYISRTAGFNAQAKVGYHLHNFRIEAGFQFNTTGYKQGLVFSNQFPITTPTGSIKTTYSEISIPVSVGYQIPFSSKFTLVPYLGFSTGYSYRVHYVTKHPDEPEHSGALTGYDFRGYYYPINFWGNTAVHIEYKISNRFEILTGPSFQYMLTDMLKSSSAIPESNTVQHNYMYGFDLGVKVNL